MTYGPAVIVAGMAVDILFVLWVDIVFALWGNAELGCVTSGVDVVRGDDVNVTV